MKLDLLDSLIALGLVGAEQGALASRILGDDVGALEKLAIVGVDTAPLLPVVSSLSGIALCPPMLLACPIAAALAPDKAAAVRALRICVLRQEPNAPLDVVVADPDVRPRVKEILGPFFRAHLVSHDELRRLIERTTPSAEVLPNLPLEVVEAPTLPLQAATSSVGPGSTSTGAPSLANIDNAQLGAVADSAPRPKLSAEATAQAMAEKVDIDDDTKRLILDLDGKIDRVTPRALLGLPESATGDDVKERYYELSRRFHPDAYFRKNLGTYRARLNRVFKALKAASDQLVVEAEARDHLDLDAPNAQGHAPAYQPPDLELSGGSRPVPQPISPPTRPTPARPFQLDTGRRAPTMSELENAPSLETEPILRTTPSRGVREPPTGSLPRTGPLRRPPTSQERARKAALPFIAAAGALVVVIVVAAGAWALSRPKNSEPPVDIDAKQAQLLTIAKTQSKGGFFADAIATASQAIDLAPYSTAAAEARVIRGVAFLDGADRESGIADLKTALAALPPDDPERPLAESALAKETKHE